MRFIDVDSDSKVEVYNNLLKGKDVMVLFYMDGCGACEGLKPEWNKFEKQVMKSKGGEKTIVAKVKSLYMNDIEGYKSIIGYPTIYHLRNGEKIGEFSDNRTSDSLMRFYKSISGHKGGKRVSKTRKYKRRTKTNKRKHKRKSASKKRKRTYRRRR